MARRQAGTVDDESYIVVVIVEILASPNLENDKVVIAKVNRAVFVARAGGCIHTHTVRIRVAVYQQWTGKAFPGRERRTRAGS